MTVQEQLRQTIQEQESNLRGGVPRDRQVAILALLARLACLPGQGSGGQTAQPDLVTGREVGNLGGNKALHLCLTARGDQAYANAAPEDLECWAKQFLHACGDVAAAELVLAHTETGFMGLIAGEDGAYQAWISTKRPPTSWQERADIAWWAAWLAKPLEPELQALRATRPAAGSGPAIAAPYYRQLASVYLQMMAYQLGYPPDADIAGITVQTYRDVLALLMAQALQARDRDAGPVVQSESALAAALAKALAIDPAVIARALSAFVCDQENAAYHATVPGVAAAPLVRLGPDRLASSCYGLTTQPLFYLAHELRRRDAQAYNTSAFLREDVFRQDLYALFPAKRFVTSSGRITLRRAAGDVRTDIDAVVFDRKTGALGLFELKSQDPFARSSAELARQRDNVLYANRQLSGVLDWLKRQGGDDLLSRVDARTAKTFRVNKVYPFVLGRYLVHFHDGPQPDRRAAWGTWPQLLRLHASHPITGNEANPLSSLFTRLSSDPLHSPPSAAQATQTITLGASRLIVYGSYAAFHAASGGK